MNSKEEFSKDERDSMYQMGHGDTKDNLVNQEKEETKEEVKKEETKEEVKKEETKEEVKKEETKEEVKKEETKEEVKKEETTEEKKEEVKEEVKKEELDEIKEELKEEPKEIKEETKEELKEEIKEETSEDSKKEIKEKIEKSESNIEKCEEAYKKKKLSFAKKLIIGIGSGIVVIALVVGFFIYRSLNKLNYVDYDKKDYGQETFDIETDDDLNRKADEEVKAEQINFDEVKGNTIYDENVINILCVGDDQESTQNGHGNSDSILVLSIHKKLKTIKVVSLMRDMYVPIGEGYSNNKINAAYNAGGINLLKSTIERNFKIPIDGALVVHFDTFPELIDKLGGVRATLNKQEADYINGKLHDDDIESNLCAGDIHLNGEQTLWFSRIRKVSSEIYGQDDFGRTCRQRHVLDELFEKYKKMSYMDMYNTVDTVAKIVDIDKNLKDKLFTLARIVSTFNAEKIENLRIPLDGAYTNARVFIGQNSVLVLNVSNTMQKNVNELHMFLYGNNVLKDVTANKIEMEEDEVKQNNNKQMNSY